MKDRILLLECVLQPSTLKNSQDSTIFTVNIAYIMLLPVEFLKNFSFCSLHLPKYSLGQNTRLLMLSSRDEQIDHHIEKIKEAKNRQQLL